MKELHVSPDLALPLDAVTQKFAFLARTGAGKTYAAMKLCEEMLDAGAQVVALDPVGVWYGLRLAADGRGAGFAIPVFGGEHGDVPLEPKSGALVADLIVDRGVSAVLDVSMFESKAQHKQFAADFAERLFFRKKSARSPLHLFFEEAQEFVPQFKSKGEERMLGAFERLIKLGRNYGVGASLISQRPQAVNKDVLNQTECLFALQTTGPQERKAVEGWIHEKGLDEDISALLPKLKVGEARVWSPAWLGVSETVQIGRKKTFDASATPAFGSKAARPRELTPVDVDEIRRSMAEVVQRAEENDPAKLKREVAELKRQLAARDRQLAERQAAASQAQVVEVPVITDEQIRRLEVVEANLAGLKTYAELMSEALEDVEELHALITEGVRRFRAAKEAPAAPQPRPAAPAPRPVAAKAARRDATPDVQVKAGARRMLEVVAAHSQFRVTRAQLATLARMKVTGGTFQTYFSTLKREGLIVENDGQVQITGDGMAYLGVEAPPAPQTTEELLAQWRPALKRGAAEMLDRLVDAYPAPVSKDALAGSLDMAVTGGTFQTYLSTLRRNGLAEVEGNKVKASPTLFFGA